MSSLEELDALARSDDDEVAQKAIDELAAHGDAPATDVLIGMLSSPDAALRDRAAHALDTIGDLRVVGPLVDAITLPENASYRGTLVYSLQSFDCSDLFPVVFECAVSGNYEVESIALTILKEQRFKTAPADIDRVEQMLAEYAGDPSRHHDESPTIVDDLRHILARERRRLETAMQLPEWTRQLAEARDARTIVRVCRWDLEDGHVDGYVVGLGPDLLQLLVVDDDINLNGYSVLRLADLTSVEVPTPFAEFQQRVLTLRGREPAETTRIDLTSLGAAIGSAGRQSPITTIHREGHDPDVCHIGRVRSITERAIELVEINPDATWDEETTTYRRHEITRVDFGGQYEDALWLVGGPSAPAEG